MTEKEIQEDLHPEMDGTDMVRLSLNMVLGAFGAKKDLMGRAKVNHSLRVGLSGRNLDEQTVGFLHDIVEDTSITLETLKDQGFPDYIVQAVDLLTHRKEDSYGQYINRIGNNALAIAVKLNDLKDNIGRLDDFDKLGLHEKRKDLESRYRLAKDYLEHRKTASLFAEPISVGDLYPKL